MEQFRKDILNFLESEYNDAYTFRFEVWAGTPKLVNGKLKCEEQNNLRIKITPQYERYINDDGVKYILNFYNSKEYLEDRKQYRWQKELIDMIEGS